MTQSSSTETIWLTQDAYDKLQAELQHLRGPGRQEIVERISSARDEGDLKENGGYHAAKEEQGKNEARVRQLRHLLENARIGTPPSEEGVVAQGQVVTVRFPAFDDTETFLLGSREEAATASIDVYSPTSPLGAAVLGQPVGATVGYETPTGKPLQVEIISAEPYTG